ncbi:SDR family oxidoreductase [Sphingobium sp. WCS2017Hpa-17]|uniref:SDR family NAD(P)-dependent oxidoreductase n=1 Tax=Sphingobium sp. WCS2017Hpa-17 TaxID=3073638 RepID=UPI0028890328|nr:SDR family oxidoreductase [Sphingobium sp. WCS2017Hpa-17]
MTKDRLIAVVTGGGSGIGRSAALAFAGEGYGVAVADANVEAAAAVALAIEADGGLAIPLHVDVTDAAACEDMIEAITQKFGRLDAAFNNAGITERSLTRGETPPETHLLPLDIWRKVLAVDLDGVFNCARAELPLMLEQGSGAIVNTASMQGHVSIPRSAAYTAAKHGVIGLTKTIAKEYGGRGIRCNAVSPGIVSTPLTSDIINSADYQAPLLAAIPAGRFAEGDDVARAVLWLCGTNASYVNGATLIVDGGYLA